MVHGVHICLFFGNSRMQIRKKWLNQLKNFLTNILKNIIWHLFAGESHQVVKITVTYWVYLSVDSQRPRKGLSGSVMVQL